MTLCVISYTLLYSVATLKCVVFCCLLHPVHYYTLLNNAQCTFLHTFVHFTVYIATHYCTLHTTHCHTLLHNTHSTLPHTTVRCTLHTVHCHTLLNAAHYYTLVHTAPSTLPHTASLAWPCCPDTREECRLAHRPPVAERTSLQLLKNCLVQLCRCAVVPL